MTSIADRILRLLDENLEIEGRSPGDPLSLDNNIADAGVSSPDIVAFWKLVNEEFGVDIPAEDFAELLTPKDLIEYLDARAA